MALNLPIATQFNPQGVNDAKKAFLTLGQGVSKSSGVMGTAMGKLGGAIAGGFALHKLKEFAKETIHLAVENQRAQAMLDRQIKNSTKVTEEQLHANEEWIISQQFASGVGKNELRPALAQLVRVTKDLNQSQTLLNLAMDVSAGTGKPLAQVSLALSRAYMGSTLSLKKLGIQVKDASGKALSFDQIQQSLAKTFAGATATSAATASGQLAIASLRFEEMKEAIGMNLLPVLQSLLATLMPIIIAFTAMPKGVQQVVTLMLVAGIAFKSATTALVGLEVAMATAQISMGVLIGVIAVATIAYTVLSGRKQEAKKVTQDLTTALLGEASATNEALAELASHSKGVMRFIEGQKQAGIATKDVSEYIKSGTGVMAGYQTQVLEILDATKGSQPELIAIAKAFNFDQDPNWDDKASLIRDLALETKKLRDEQIRLANVTKLVGQVSGQTESDLAELGGETDSLTSDLKTLGDEWEATIKKFNEQDTMTGLAESFAKVVVAGQKAFGSTSQADMADYQKELHSAYKSVHDYLITIENLPTKVETEILAQLNRNDFAGALASLQAIPTTIGVDIVPHFGSADSMERQANKAGNTARQTIQGIIDALTKAKDTSGGGDSKKLSAEEKRLEKLIEKVKDLKTQMQEYRKGLQDAFNINLDADKSKGSALTQTRNTLKEIKEFSDNIKRLQARGVGTAILKEVADAGLFGGNSLAKDILNMTDLDFREFKAGQTQIANIASQTAGFVSEQAFGGQIAKADAKVVQEITINMPAGSNGDDVVKALQAYQRRRGSIPITVNGNRTV